MTTVEPDFYDRAMTDPGAPSMLPLERSPWLPLYEEAASWIKANEPVIDLGCGTGRFAKQISLIPGRYGTYTGFDFSAHTITEARRYCPGLYDVVDLREWHVDEPIDGATIFTCLEVLEHLADDLDLAKRVPPGHRFIFSVPNYASEAHLRVFPSLGLLWARYGNLVTFNRWTRIELDERKVIHLIDSTRRTDSW